MDNREHKHDQLQLGQHFLKDERILNGIVAAANLTQDDVVLEAGFGQGNLTKKIAQHCKVIAIEIDRSLSLNINNAEIKYGNALEMIDDINFTKFVSNIPYHIAEPLIKKLLPRKDCSLAVMLVSASFAEILTSEKKLGILSRSIFSVEKITDVPASAFYPAPDTKSAVIKLARKNDEEKSELEKILSEIIYQHDKKIKNALEKHFLGKLTKKQVKEKFSNLGETGNKGIFSISEEQFQILLQSLK